MKTDPILQEVLDEFEKELGFWFPNNVDALTLDGDARSMKERIRGCITSAVHRTREATLEEKSKEMLREQLTGDWTPDQIEAAIVMQTQLVALLRKERNQ